jgi:heat shock protein HslJ
MNTRWSMAAATILGILSLACSQNSTLPAGDVIGTTWTLSQVNGEVVDTAAVNRTPTLMLDADGRASGNAGCNQFGGEYELTGSTLRFGPLAMTRMACPGRMDIETAYSEALDMTREWRVRDGMLELMAGDRVLARFRR